MAMTMAHNHSVDNKTQAPPAKPQDDKVQLREANDAMNQIQIQIRRGASYFEGLASTESGNQVQRWRRRRPRRRQRITSMLLIADRRLTKNQRFVSLSLSAQCRNKLPSGLSSSRSIL